MLAEIEKTMRRKRILPKSPAALQQRTGRLTVIRNLKIARSAHAYVRGSTARFYEWMASSDPLSIPRGPAIWICGDCHTGNLGPVTDAEGNIAVQIRDLDQAVIGNPAHDLIRLGLSVAMAVRGSNLPGVGTALALEALTSGYASAFATGRNKLVAPSPVRAIVDLSQARRWRHLAEERIADSRSHFPLGKRFWPVSKQEHRQIVDLFATAEVAALVRMMKKHGDHAEVVVEDCAYWMKGCSSLGNLRYAVLVRVVDSKSKSASRCLIDIKEAVAALAPRYGKAAMPLKNAERVVTGARHLSPLLGQRMLATQLCGKSVFIRELAPQDLKLDLDKINLADTVKVTRYLAAVVGAAHARQLSPELRRDWLREFTSPVRSRTLKAPAWLWDNILGLVANHEVGYLEHCRTHAVAFA